jgi:RsiW-degrading membrane proteinase PrsW (M82 family)
MTVMIPLVISLVLGLLPGFAWLVFYLGEETHPEPKRLIAFTAVIGMAFGFFAVAIEMFFNKALGGWGIGEFSILSLAGLALIEEFMKFTAAHFAVSKSPAFSEPTDAMIYTIVAALGFATLENIGALSNIATGVTFVPALLATLSFRFVGATLLHSLTSAIVGYYWALGLVRGKTKRYILLGLAIATALHTCFNYLILTYGNSAYGIVLLVIIGFFVLNDFEKLKTKINLI